MLEIFKKTSKRGMKRAEKMVRKARTKTHQQTLEKLTIIENGKRWIFSDPPLLVPLREMGLEKYVSAEDLRRMTEQSIEDAWSQYLDSLPDERRYLLSHFRIVDAALRVGGVGSVGTRSSIVLLESEVEDEALILQLKEASPSVLEAYVDKTSYRGHGERVVTGQRLMQATSAGADTMAVACPKCKIHLTCAMKDKSLKKNYGVEIRDIATITLARLKH